MNHPMKIHFRGSPRIFPIVFASVALLCAAPLSAQELLKPSFAAVGAAQVRDAGGAMQIVAETATKAAPAGIEQNLGEPPAGLYRFRARLQADVPLPVEVRVRLAPRPGTVYGSRAVRLQPGVAVEMSGFALVPDLQNDAVLLSLAAAPGSFSVTQISLQATSEAALSAAEKRELEAQLGPQLPPVDEKKLLEETDARIRKHRTGPLTIRVLDAQGRPLTNQRVTVRHLRHGFKFGTLLRSWVVPHEGETPAETREREALLRLFNYATIDIKPMMKKAFPNGPKPAAAPYAQVLRQIAWLKSNGITPRGHVVAWNTPDIVPGWVAKTPTPTDAMKNLLDAHLQQMSQDVIPQFADVDVWNEPVQYERWENPLTALMRQDGVVLTLTRYLKEFKRLNPNVPAVVNDFDSTPAFYTLLRQLIEAGAPVDVIGQQTHGGLSRGPQGLWTMLERLSLLKRPILLSELSVMSGPRGANGAGKTTPEGEARQAEEAETFYRLAYSHPNVVGVVIWNLSDNKSWKRAPRGFLREDGTRKPSFERIDNLINRAWRTNGEFATSEDGTVVIPNAFEGEYQFAVGGATTRGVHATRAPLQITLKTP